MKTTSEKINAPQNEYPKIVDQYSGQSGHFLVPAHSHPHHLQISECAGPFAMVEEPNT